MKSLIALWSTLANELAGRCSTSTTMDIKTVHRRSEHEGLSFLTITLPQFGKDFQYCLDQGVVTPESFLPFKKVGSCLPSFLRGFMESVFDSKSGILLSSPSIEAIYAIRQLTLIFSKILLPCTPSRVQDAMDGYVECDREIDEGYGNIPESDLSDFRRISNLLYRSMFSEIEGLIFNSEIVPKHGPGAVAEHLTSNGKYSSRYWPSRLEEVFHVGDFLYPNSRFISNCYDEVDFAEPGAEIPSRVISVPKTQKAPRIIAIEPTPMQFVQQGILERINANLGRTDIGQFICSDDQSPNQRLAQKGSSDGSLATLDLSEASDRVHSELVRLMCSDFPLFEKAIFACRSERASVPGHGDIHLAKFASMGSALCFPFEAMVFLTVIFLGIERSLGYRFTKESDFRRFFGMVRVYGDDIVIPVDYVFNVVALLEVFNFKVSSHKSFWNGRFRESCGKEYYDGHDVSIVKVRRMFPLQRQHVPEVVSLVSLRNQFYCFGCWETVKHLDSILGSILKYLPKVLPSSSALGLHSFLGYIPEKMCEQLHVPLVKAHVLSSKSPRDPLDGSDALLKYFLYRGSQPRDDEEHLERAGRPRVAYIKTRWVKPF